MAIDIDTNEIEDFKKIFNHKHNMTTLTFGKYKGMTITQAYESDIRYCKWLHNQTMMMESHPEIKAFLDKHLQGDDGTYTLTWGKHKNNTIRWVQKNDNTYFAWLLKSDFVGQNCPKLKESLNKLV